jgi:hypothetical protein
MLTKSEVKIRIQSKLGIEYRDDLERLFFFNHNQKRYAGRITESVSEYAKPKLFEDYREVSLEFEQRDLGQTLYIFDDDDISPELVGVLMYVRDSIDRITIVHIAMHEHCRQIFKQEAVNVVKIVLDEVFTVISKIKGIERIRIYYSGREFGIGRN